MRVEVRLEEATPISGGLLFSVLSDPQEPVQGWRRSHRSGGGGRDRGGRGGGGKARSGVKNQRGKKKRR
jgi:ribonuclease R